MEGKERGKGARGRNEEKDGIKAGEERKEGERKKKRVGNGKGGKN